MWDSAWLVNLGCDTDKKSVTCFRFRLKYFSSLKKKVLKWLWVNSTAKQLKQPGSHSDAIDCDTLEKGAVISFKKLNFGGF